VFLFLCSKVTLWRTWPLFWCNLLILIVKEATVKPELGTACYVYTVCMHVSSECIYIYSVGFQVKRINRFAKISHFVRSRRRNKYWREVIKYDIIKFIIALRAEHSTNFFAQLIFAAMFLWNLVFRKIIFQISNFFAWFIFTKKCAILRITLPNKE